MRIATCLLMSVLGAGCTDSDNVSWVIVSNPSGGSTVQGGLVITWRYSSKSVSILGGLTDGVPAAVLVEESGGRLGTNPNVRRTMLLATQSDAVAVIEKDATVLHSPAVPEGVWTMNGSVRFAPGRDEATAWQLVSSFETVHVAAGGNLVLTENASGVVAMRPGATQLVFPAGSDIESSGVDYLVVEPSGRRTLVKPPPPTPVGTQAQFDRDRDSYRFFSYDNRFSAELPANRFVVRDGSGGIRLDGDFPDAAGGALDSPFRAILTARNHHLLLVRRE